VTCLVFITISVVETGASLLRQYLDSSYFCFSSSQLNAEILFDLILRIQQTWTRMVIFKHELLHSILKLACSQTQY